MGDNKHELRYIERNNEEGRDNACVVKSWKKHNGVLMNYYGRDMLVCFWCYKEKYYKKEQAAKEAKLRKIARDARKNRSEYEIFADELSKATTHDDRLDLFDDDESEALRDFIFQSEVEKLTKKERKRMKKNNIKARMIMTKINCDSKFLEKILKKYRDSLPGGPKHEKSLHSKSNNMQRLNKSSKRRGPPPPPPAPQAPKRKSGVPPPPPSCEEISPTS